jgi:hypothetical protein
MAFAFKFLTYILDNINKQKNNILTFVNQPKTRIEAISFDNLKNEK